MNKFVHSLLFRGVVAHLLLFVFLFIKDIDFFCANIYDFLIYYFTSLIILILVLGQPSRTLSRISDQLDHLIESDVSENGELSNLSDKVKILEKSISISRNNLESQRNQLDSILTYMVDGVIATDRQGNVILANTAAQNYLNQSAQDLLDHPITKVLNISHEYSFYDLLEKEPELVIDTTNHLGKPIFLRVKFVLFRRESGFIAGIVAVLNDKTEQEKLEQEQKQFVSNVSHELRTPLTSVKAYLEALEDGAIHDPEVAHSFIHVSLNETNRMIRMISDLLTLSRIDQKKLPLNKEVVNFVDFLRFQVGRLAQLADADPLNNFTGKFHFVVDFPKGPIWLEIDPDKITQVIDNIIGNALKYSPDGGEIRVTLVVKPSKVLLTISDQGMGISKNDLANVFKRFYRVDQARNSQTGGTGLGLSIVKNIITLHGGSIDAQSQGIGKGTSFIICLPYTDQLSDYNNNQEWDATFDSEFDEVNE